MRRAVGLLSVLCLWIAVGCSEKVQVTGGKPVQKKLNSVISLSPSTTEILTLGGTPLWLKGRTKYDDYPPSASHIPVVAAVKPDYEAIAQIKPDLVVLDAALYNAADMSKLTSLGSTIFLIDADTIDLFIVELYKLGSATGTETTMASYVNKIRHARELSLGGSKDRPTVAILSPGPGGSDYIAGKGSFEADMVRAAGGEPVGPDGDKFVPLNAESLVRLNPAAIVTAGPATDFVKDPRFVSLSATKGGRVAGMPEGILLRRGSRVEQAIVAIHSFIMGGR